MSKRNSGMITRQQGLTLVFTMIFLALMVATGLVAIQIAGFQQKMATNFHNNQDAFIAAEAALREAEKCVKNQMSCSDITKFSPTCADGLCFTGSDKTSITTCRAGNNSPWEDGALWRDLSRTKNAVSLFGTGVSARYIIEFICYVPKDIFGVTPNPNNPADWSKLYRITTLATVDNVNSQVMLQSTYKR